MYSKNLKKFRTLASKFFNIFILLVYKSSFSHHKKTLNFYINLPVYFLTYFFTFYTAR